LCGAGPKCRREQSQKGDENRAHCGNDDDLTNGRNPRRLSPDRIFGKDKARRPTAFRTIWQFAMNRRKAGLFPRAEEEADRPALSLTGFCRPALAVKPS
jgi:hypothetical protein